MKRKFGAVIAVAAALAAPGLTLAQSENVQIYGALDLRWDTMRYTASSPATGAPGVGNAASTKQHVYPTANRWGLRGRENLGSGLAVFFQLESGVATDGRPTNAVDVSGINALGGRDTYVGLSSSAWGSLQAGSFNTPYTQTNQVWSVIPTFGHGGIIIGGPNTTGALPSPACGGVVSTATGALTAAAAAGTTCTSNGVESGVSFDRRQSDHIQYTTPTFGGFVFRVSTAVPEYEVNTSGAPGSSAAVGALSAGHKAALGSYSLTWIGGPFSFAGAYEQHRGFRAALSTTTPQNAKDSALRFGGRWNYGAGLFGTVWERFEFGNAAAAGLENNFKIDNWAINGTFNVGPNGVFSAGYSRTAGAKECGAGLTRAVLVTGPTRGNIGGGIPSACGDNGKASNFSLAYDHRLSKRTAVYAVAALLNNGSGTTYYYVGGPPSNNNSGSTGGAGVGTDVTTYALGVKHTF